MLDQLQVKLTEKWQGRPCPLCNTNEWVIGELIMGLPFLRSTGVLPLFMVVCDNCGNTVFLDAETLGLWPEGGEEKE